MSARVTQRRVYEREQVREILREALELTSELEPHPELRGHVFNAAVGLVSASTMQVEQSPLLAGVLGQAPKI